MENLGLTICRKTLHSNLFNHMYISYLNYNSYCNQHNKHLWHGLCLYIYNSNFQLFEIGIND